MGRPPPIVLAVLGLSLVGLPAATRADPRVAVTGREAVDRFSANIRSFPHYTSKYTVTRGEAYTFDDALAGRWVNAVTIDCVLRVDGEFEVWTGRKPPLPLGGPPPARPGQWAAAWLLWFPDFNYVGNSRVGLTDAQGLSGAWNLLPSDHGFGPVPAPIGAGHGRKQSSVGGPNAYLADPDWELTDDGLVEADGGRRHRIRPTHTYESNGRTWREVECFHLDPARGHLPAYSSMDGNSLATLDGRPYYQTYLLAARDCGNGRWFPERVLSVRALMGAGMAHLIEEMRVTDLDLTRPPEGALTVTLPAGALVISDADFRKKFRLGSAQTIRPRHLPELEAELDATVPPPGLLEQMLPGRAVWRRVAFAAGGCLTVLLVGLVWRWRRRNAVRTASVPQSD
jgi:hypothetical protein